METRKLNGQDNVWVVFTGGNNPTVTVYGNYSYACYRDAPKLCN